MILDQKALSRELRKKFRSPRDAILALGLDEYKIAKRPRKSGMAFDAEMQGMSAERCAKLDAMLKDMLDPEEYARASRLMTGDDDLDEKDKSGETWDAEPVKELLRTRGMSEDDIETVLDMMPDIPGNGEGGMGRSAMQGGMGGKAPRETGGHQIGAMDRRRMHTAVLGMDAASTKRLFETFPEMRRIGQTWDGNVDRRDI
jgi:hypothetical protein